MEAGLKLGSEWTAIAQSRWGADGSGGDNSG